MEEYIGEATRQAFFRPSTSPASAGFFFVEKRDGGLRPFIDYRGLNHRWCRRPWNSYEEPGATQN